MKMNSFSKGFKQILIAGKFFWKERSLWKFSLIPLIINIIIFIFFSYFVFNKASNWLAGILIGNWLLASLYWVIVFFLLVAVSLFIAFTFSLACNIIAAPFNDVLSEKTASLWLKKEKKEEKFSFKLLIGNIKYSFKNEIKRVLFFALAQLLLFILYVLPGVGNILYSILSFGLTCSFLSFEYMDYSMSREKLDFGKKWELMWDYRYGVLGFGTGVIILVFIPLLNLFFLPLSVVSGTIFYLKLKEASLSEIYKN